MWDGEILNQLSNDRIVLIASIDEQLSGLRQRYMSTVIERQDSQYHVIGFMKQQPSVHNDIINYFGGEEFLQQLEKDHQDFEQRKVSFQEYVTQIHDMISVYMTSVALYIQEKRKSFSFQAFVTKLKQWFQLRQHHQDGDLSADEYNREATNIWRQTIESFKDEYSRKGHAEEPPDTSDIFTDGVRFKDDAGEDELGQHIAALDEFLSIIENDEDYEYEEKIAYIRHLLITHAQNLYQTPIRGTLNLSDEMDVLPETVEYIETFLRKEFVSDEAIRNYFRKKEY